jgi:hypothetical protein
MAKNEAVSAADGKAASYFAAHAAENAAAPSVFATRFALERVSELTADRHAIESHACQSLGLMEEPMVQGHPIGMLLDHMAGV